MHPKMQNPRPGLRGDKSRMLTMAGISRLHSFLSLPMGPLRPFWMVATVAVIFLLHIVLFNGTLDIYFTSPTIGEISKTHRAPLSNPPARRVILFVVDGLRARSLFTGKLELAPHLRKIVLKRGAWGVSYARTPTLSRTGHLSLLSGVYEYKQGLTRPPSVNPFDSIFNRSSASWLFGEHEVVEIFDQRRKPDSIHSWYYPAAFNDFSMKDPALLDNLVFDRLKVFFHNASSDAKLEKKVRGRGVVFMTHLLGVDTYSHSHQTSGEGLRRLITSVDRGIRQMEALFEKFYNHDRRTTYILSADHGMARWSGHGAGNSLDEIMTPLVAWGAGIRRPIPSDAPEADQEMWSIPTKRSDIAQVDVCPLMAAVLGVAYPVHSVGRLPADLLNVSHRTRVQMLRANALQVLEQYVILRRQTQERSLSFLFVDFAPLVPSKVGYRLEKGDTAAKKGEYAAAIGIYQSLIKDSVEGIYYYHRYYKLFSLVCVSALFVLCVLSFALISVRSASANGHEEAAIPTCEMVLFGGVLIILLLFAFIDSRPAPHWLYLALIVNFVWALYRNCGLLKSIAVSLTDVKYLLVIVCLTELMVWSFFHCGLISIAMLVHTWWDIAQLDSDMRSSLSCRLYFVGSIFLSIAPNLPNLGLSVTFPLVYLGPLLTTIVVIGLLRRQGRESPNCTKCVVFLISIQLFILLCSCFNHYRTHSSVNAGLGMPVAATLVTKVLLISSIIMVLIVKRFGSSDMTLLSVWLSVISSMTLFSLFLETVALFLMAITLGAWVSLHKGYAVPYYIQPWSDKPAATESKAGSSGGSLIGPAAPSKKRAIDIMSLYYSCAFIMYLYLGSRSIGNIPTISSYDPHTVLCLKAVFDLGIMILIVFLKNVLPFILTTCHFLLLTSDVNINDFYRMAILFADVITLHFVFFIRSSQGWTVYATSVNHFTTSMLYLAFLSVIFPLARLMTKMRN